MANEVVLVDQWLYGVLSADATLASLVSNHIYSYLRMDGGKGDFVVYNFQGGADVMAVGGIRIMNSGLYQVKAITQSNTMLGSTRAIADRIDTLLHGVTGTVAGGIILGCVRQQPISYVESSSGLRYNHCGGIYRAYVQST